MTQHLQYPPPHPVACAGRTEQRFGFEVSSPGCALPPPPPLPSRSNLATRNPCQRYRLTRSLHTSHTRLSPPSVDTHTHQTQMHATAQTHARFPRAACAPQLHARVSSALRTRARARVPPCAALPRTGQSSPKQTISRFLRTHHTHPTCALPPLCAALRIGEERIGQNRAPSDSLTNMRINL